MSRLALFYHPLSSYCWKALIALYEGGTSFTPRMINLGDESEAEALRRVWPMQRFPVLDDPERGMIVPEASIIIEYLGIHYPGTFVPIPKETDEAIEVRLMDRIFDNDVMTPMQTIVGNRIRSAGTRDAFGIQRAEDLLAKAYRLLEDRLAGRAWAAGDAFSLADCGAGPSLHYADKVVPFRTQFPILAAYLANLETRPSFARVLEEAQPYMQFFPRD